MVFSVNLTFGAKGALEASCANMAAMYWSAIVSRQARSHAPAL
jgi:hypothetical protein